MRLMVCAADVEQLMDEKMQVEELEEQEVPIMM